MMSGSTMSPGKLTVPEQYKGSDITSNSDLFGNISRSGTPVRMSFSAAEFVELEKRRFRFLRIRYCPSLSANSPVSIFPFRVYHLP
uniref:Uncharacterized protein n=1 Tax=Raphanus sativus TaxID=3726 RepID=A0A650GBL9_RAPSA|nr:hypothetical protein [Raphanus sativus]